MGVKRVRLVTVVTVVAAGVAAVVVGMVASRSFSEGDAKGAWTAPEAEAAKVNPVAADEESLKTGKAAFAKYCVMCHGELGKGDGAMAAMFDPAPKDLHDEKIVKQSDGAMYWKVTTGKKPMPGFEQTLSEKERWSVVNYVRKLAPPVAATTTSQPATGTK